MDQNSKLSEKEELKIGRGSDMTDNSQAKTKQNSETVEDKQSETKGLSKISKEKHVKIVKGGNSNSKGKTKLKAGQNTKTMKDKQSTIRSKSEPVGGNQERLNKIRHEFQKRLYIKLGFFNSIRAQEKKWGVREDLDQRRLITKTADPKTPVRASTPINVFITQESQ